MGTVSQIDEMVGALADLGERKGGNGVNRHLMRPYSGLPGIMPQFRDVMYRSVIDGLDIE